MTTSRRISLAEPDRIADRPTGRVAGVRETLGRQIASSEYGVGDTLPIEPDLAERLGVSRSTIREAVRALVSLGMLEVRTKSGTRVRPRRNWNVLNRDVLDWLTASGPGGSDLIAAIDEAREIFEPPAAALAATRASAADVAAIWQAFGRMDAGIADGDVPATIRADQAFHMAILSATGNPILEAFDSAIDAILGLLFEVATADHEQSFRENLQNHRRVAEAIEAGDTTAARDAMIDTVLYTRTNLQKHVLTP